MCTFLTVFLACPVGVWAAGNGGTGSGVPVWLCIPFAGLLLCVAVMPLVKGEWWESHQRCGCILDRSYDHSVCSCLRCRKNCGNST